MVRAGEHARNVPHWERGHPACVGRSTQTGRPRSQCIGWYPPRVMRRSARLVLLGLLAFLAGVPSTGGAALAQNGPLVVAYYVSWDPRSWHALEANADAIDVVAAQWVTVDPCGGIGSRDDQTLKQFARARGISVFPSLVTFSGWLNHRLLTDPEIRSRVLEELVAYVVAEDYEGFDLDLEGVLPEDRAAYTSFVQELGERLRVHGKRLSLALGPKTRDATTGWSGAYDYAALGELADHILIMTYEFSGPWGEPGPIAPAGWVEDVIVYASSQIPAEKLLLGLAFYGYDWNTVTGQARALGYHDAVAVSAQYGAPIALDLESRSGTFRYLAPAGSAPARPAAPPAVRQTITVREPPPCNVALPPPPPTRTPRPASPAETPEEHVVWIEESQSAQARLEIGARHRVGGIGAWRLGQDDPAVWPALREWRAGARRTPDGG